jgi:signal transduction histidine kinase
LILSFRQKCVVLRVRDNGIGFSPDSPPFTNLDFPSFEDGLGMKNIQERARLLGGKVKFWSRPDRGTRIEVQVPCHPP